jgi:hypothetical protein
MKKLLMVGTGVLLACLAIGPATASAAGSANGTLVACLGAGTADGSFETQTVGTGTLPVVGLGLTEPLCVMVKPSMLTNSVTNLVNGLKNVKPPTGLPTQQDLEALIAAIQQIPANGPLAALSLAFATCQALHAADSCSALIGAGLGALPFPLGTVTLQGNNDPCYLGTQSGTGSALGQDFLLLDWTANYGPGGGNLLGAFRGTADSVFEGDRMYKVNGLIGPGCGGGVKALVFTVSNNS